MDKHDSATPSALSRRSEIVALLERQGEEAVDALAQRFGVSGMTIRRDLQDLAADGKVIRTHGGAAPAARVSFEFRFLDRVRQYAPQKDAIAQLAVSLVKPGQAVLLDSGTTTLAIARLLKTIPKLTVITTSLPIASELFGVEDVDLILLGGRLRKDAPDLIGAITDHSLEVLRADLAFIGADAVDAQGDAYSASPELGRLLARMAHTSTSAYVVADSSKFGRQELMRFAHLGEWAGVITDAQLDPKLRRAYQKRGIQVIQPPRS